MSDVTRILEAIERGQPQAAEQLLPLVYDELRRLAARMMAHEKPGQTLQPTALVNEAYLRLVEPGWRNSPQAEWTPEARQAGAEDVAEPEQEDLKTDRSVDHTGPGWQNRRHFFAAAAEAMRRVLVENARRKARLKHGGQRHRDEFKPGVFEDQRNPEVVLFVDDALVQLESLDPVAGQLVKLRYFSGHSLEEAAKLAGVSRATAYRHWSYAKAWLHEKLKSG